MTDTTQAAPDFRPLTEIEIIRLGRQYSDANMVRAILEDTRLAFPDALGLGCNSESEYDDEGGSYLSASCWYVMLPDGKYVRVDHEDIQDQDGVAVALPEFLADADADADTDASALVNHLAVGVRTMGDLHPNLYSQKDNAGPGETNLWFADLEQRYLTELPTLYVAVAQ